MKMGLLQVQQQSRIILRLALALLIVRVITIAVMGVMPQDAYYYFYSEHLALSYFDHPPMVGWMLWVFTSLLDKSIYAIHTTDFLVTLTTVYSVWLLAQRILPAAKAARAMLLFFSTIMVSILSIITTPDVPLLLFWALSLLFVHKAISSNQVADWVLTGVMMGCAFLSKYTAVFLPAGLFLFLLVSNEHRKKIWNYQLILVCIVFAIVASPVVIWNVQNDFISFKFQSGTRFNNMSLVNIKIKNFFGTIGHQLFIVVPVLFIALWLFVWKYIKKGWKKLKAISTNNLFLLSFFLPMVLFFFGVSVFYWVKINWMMPAYISGIVWVSGYMSYKWVRVQFIIALTIQILGCVFVAAYPVPVRSNDTWWGWEQLNDEVELLLRERPGYFLATPDDYKTAAVLHFTSGKKVYSGNIIGRAAKQYTITDKNAPQQLVGKNALFFQSQPGFNNENKSHVISGDLQQHFETVTELNPILIKNQKGKTLRKFFVFECKGYKP
jgi:4-amino-4-deoxy-L-arabinose transferase-like glycosyltransferase